MPAKKKRPVRSGKGRAARRKRVVRIDLVVEAQQKAVGRVGKFVEDAADMVMQGVLSPTDWLKRYAVMWRDLASDFADVAKRL